MKYRVSQTWATLGNDPCREEFDSLEAAEAYAEQLRRDIAEMVAGWTPDDPDDEDDVKAMNTVADCERRGWAQANELAENPDSYGQEAGETVAELAVEIEEIDEPDD